MDGIIIKKEWLTQIFNKISPFQEQKTWEIRRNNTTKVNQKIYLLESGSKTIVGECVLTKGIELTKELWNENFTKHQVINPFVEDISCCPWDMIIQRYPKPHALIFDNIVKYENPSKYIHPRGAVIWVKDVKKQEN